MKGGLDINNDLPQRKQGFGTHGPWVITVRFQGNHSTTYIESTEKSEYHASKVYGCCINPNRIKHHCHLPFGAYEKCCAATKTIKLSPEKKNIK